MSFLQGCICHTAVHCSTLMHAALSGLAGFKRKRHMKSEGNVEELGGRKWRDRFGDYIICT